MRSKRPEMENERAGQKKGSLFADNPGVLPEGKRTGRARRAVYARSRAPVSAAANACAVAGRADLTAVSIEAVNAITADGEPEPAAARAP